MANPYRGEIALSVDGKVYTLRLTLGALASLEARLGAASLSDLMDRLMGSAVSFREVETVLTEALMAGETLTAETAAPILERAAPRDLTSAYVALMRATFGGEGAR